MFHVSNVTVTFTEIFLGLEKVDIPTQWTNEREGYAGYAVKSNKYLYSILGHNLAFFFGIYQANHTTLDFTVGFVV